MKLKAFLKMGDLSDEIEVEKDKEIFYTGTIENYLKDKKSVNGVITGWYMYTENYDYSVMHVTIEQ